MQVSDILILDSIAVEMLHTVLDSCAGERNAFLDMGLPTRLRAVVNSNMVSYRLRLHVLCNAPMYSDNREPTAADGLIRKENLYHTIALVCTALLNTKLDMQSRSWTTLLTFDSMSAPERDLWHWIQVPNAFTPSNTSGTVESLIAAIAPKMAKHSCMSDRPPDMRERRSSALRKMFNAVQYATQPGNAFWAISAILDAAYHHALLLSTNNGHSRDLAYQMQWNTLLPNLEFRPITREGIS